MEAISKHRQIRHRPRQATRGTGGEQKCIAQCSDTYADDGFLKHQFLPLYKASENQPDKDVVEKGFFQSLSSLVGLYGCEPMPVHDKSYPYNVLLAHWDISLQLNEYHREIVVNVMQDDRDHVHLQTVQTCDTGNTLYYIPVIPLFRLLKDKKQKESGELLLSVFAYLYHVAGIPYYRDSYSSLDYYYGMMSEWLLQEDGSGDDADSNKSRSELNQAAHFGDVIFRKMYNRCHLEQFAERINSYKPSGTFEKDCLTIAKNAYDLYCTYPSRSIFEHIIPVTDDDDNDDGVIRAEQFISFVADNGGLLYKSIHQMINDEFNECGHMEQPTIIQAFCKPNENIREGLEFEYALLDLIGDLCTLLNCIP